MTLGSHTKGLFESRVKFLFSAKAKEFRIILLSYFIRKSHISLKVYWIHLQSFYSISSLINNSTQNYFQQKSYTFVTLLYLLKLPHIWFKRLTTIATCLLVRAPPCPKLQYYCIVSNFVLFSEENCKNSKELGLQKTVCYCLSLVINSVLLFGGNRISE